MRPGQDLALQSDWRRPQTMPSEEWIRRWALGWHNFWLEFDGAPFTAHTFPG